jgi:UDP-glucose 4-epimerase
MTKSLVSGGAGFIGSHLVRALLARGDEVRVLDNFSTGKREFLAEVAPDIEILEGDLRSAQQVQQAVQGVDTVFHLGAFISVPGSMKDPQTCFDVNVQGTINVMEAARQARVRRIVLASSAAVYGDSEELPLDELAAARVLSPYAASKLADEVYAGLYSRSFGLPVVALRFFNVYGPRQSPKSQYAAAIPIFIRQMLDGEPPVVFGDGQQRRDFVFVEDVVRANLLASRAEGAGGEVYNICTGVEISLLDLLGALAQILPNAPAYRFAAPRPGDIVRSLGNPEKAFHGLQFKPRVSLAEGLQRTVAWMQSADI